MFKIIRILNVAVVVVIVLAVIAGCSDNPQDIEIGIGTDETPEPTPNPWVVPTPTEEERTPDPLSENKTILTLAAYSALTYQEYDRHYIEKISQAVGRFNNASEDYFIEFTDYSQFDVEYQSGEGLTKLITEISTGKIPDIMEVRDVPFQQYVQRGLFTDLYPLLDADPDYSRDDFVQSALRAAEIDGKLYSIFPIFSIHAIISSPNLAGPDMGWNVDEFTAFLDAHTGARYTSINMTSLEFLELAVNARADEYIDWTTGRVNFNSPDFIKLLQAAARFPNEAVDLDETEQEKKFIMEPALPTIGISMNAFKVYFGGEFVLKAFPSADRTGPRLIPMFPFTITEACGHKEAAWGFIRTYFDADRQFFMFRNEMGYFPSNQTAFDKVLAHVMNEYDEDNHWTIDLATKERIDTDPLTQEDIDKLVAFVDSISGMSNLAGDATIWNIVSDDAADFFNGVISAEDAARSIHNRVEILVAERR